ncbi:hypothetical protein I350_06557 [Cryptococcus amylolentus CBS 6273]|uniref:Uncharacterized protein n=1 Tax=Cryptococcus amylolentus CBS 6273 TaxID=1296118 RepID=A0A1E3JLH4_9TREE|nr:hypothetical protein I350_06557 [Cryptococcus amylolentus CBS 6273]
MIPDDYIPPGHPFATPIVPSFPITHRPSHPRSEVPSSGSLPNPEPSHRPSLRIQTSLPARFEHPHHLPPLRHSVRHCQTAPLCLPSQGFVDVRQQKLGLGLGHGRKASLHREAFIVLGDDSPLSASRSSHPAPVPGPGQGLGVGIRPGAPKAKGYGHARRLSDKFKHLFFSAQRKRSNDDGSGDGEQGVDITHADILNARMMDENTHRRHTGSQKTLPAEDDVDDEFSLPPERPHRSPGTASFLIHRPSLPPLLRHASGLSVSTITSTSGSGTSSLSSFAVRPQWAKKAWVFPQKGASERGDGTENEKGKEGGMISRFSLSSSSSESESGQTLKSEERATSSLALNDPEGVVPGATPSGVGYIESIESGKEKDVEDVRWRRTKRLRRVRSMPVVSLDFVFQR